MREQKTVEALASTNELLKGLPGLMLGVSMASVVSDQRSLSFFSALNHKGEKFAVHQMIHYLLNPNDAKLAGIGLELGGIDQLYREYQLPLGRLDLLAAHEDSSATAIEVKDGGRGLRDVVAGIGQVAAYGCQLDESGDFTGVRKVLAWSSCTDPDADALIAKSCRASGIIPVRLVRKSQLQRWFNELVTPEYLSLFNQVNEFGVIQ